MRPVLLVSIFAIATCGLVYELIAGTAASYLLGDSVTQFSTVIGVYLAGMGLGSFFTRYVGRNLLAAFVQAELAVALVGGFSGAVLFLGHGAGLAFRVLLYAVVAVIGVLVGIELPLLLRLLRTRVQFRRLVADVLALDSLGALAASLLFPLVLVPRVGLVRSAFLFGMLNAAVALWVLVVFRAPIPFLRALRVQGCVVLAVLGAGFAASGRIVTLAESWTLDERIVAALQTPYQRILVANDGGAVRLFLNGHLQFDTRDEYRYHEALVHPALRATAVPARVLVLGGGDGMAVRELLRDPRVREVTLVELDGGMLSLFAARGRFGGLNGGALSDPRVRVVQADAFVWLRDNRGRFDAVIVDFPDPSTYALGKLYSLTFYRMIAGALAPGGTCAIQGSSPYLSPRAYWCIEATVRAAGLHTLPYHAHVPSFGEWGFVLAAHRPLAVPAGFPAALRSLTDEVMRTMAVFPPDMRPVSVEVNRLDSQALVRYFEEDWERWIGRDRS